MKKKVLRNIEWGILVCTLLLIAIGLIALFSATQNSDYEEFKKQIVWLVISVPVMITVILIDYNFFSKISPILYGMSLILLIAVLFTQPINGATSWFSIGPFTFQPAEFAKIAVTLFTAFVMVKIQKKGKDEINRVLKLGLIVLTVLIPVLFIIKQPDYGTAIAFIISLFFMLFVAGIRKRYIITVALLVVILVPVAYFFVLPEHAKSRIDVYLNPNIDPRGAGYNIIQSKLAIRSGTSIWNGITKRKSNSTRVFIS